MIYALDERGKVEHLFVGQDSTLVRSCIEGLMGIIYVDDTDNPVSACILLGEFMIFGGIPDKELLLVKPQGKVIMVPPNVLWADLILECYPDAKEKTRYTFKNDTKFDREMLLNNIRELPRMYKIEEINDDIYDECEAQEFAIDFISSFDSKDDFLEKGLGYVITKHGEIVSGASSYSRSTERIEIEVSTRKDEREQDLATAVCSALILKSLNSDLYPSFCAEDEISIGLAKKLGYEEDYEYKVYVVK